jgi:hypothetical protein
MLAIFVRNLLRKIASIQPNVLLERGPRAQDLRQRRERDFFDAEARLEVGNDDPYVVGGFVDWDHGLLQAGQSPDRHERGTHRRLHGEDHIQRQLDELPHKGEVDAAFQNDFRMVKPKNGSCPSRLFISKRLLNLSMCFLPVRPAP